MDIIKGAESIAKRLYPSGEIDRKDDRVKLLWELSDFISRIMVETDLNKIAKDTLNTIARLFRMTDMIMTIWDESIKRFRILACHGYPREIENRILNLEYTIAWINYPIPSRLLIDENMLFITAEEIWKAEKMEKPDPILMELSSDIDELLIDHPEDAHKPRKSKDEWHELDFFEFIMRDHKGKPFGYLEINDSERGILPEFSTLKEISLFANIAGIALESALMLGRQRESEERTDGLTSLMTHDLNRHFKNSIRTCEMLQRIGTDEGSWKRSVDVIIDDTREALDMIEKVARLKEIESRSAPLLIGTDPLVYLNKSIDRMKKRFPELNISIESKEKKYYLKCDLSIEDLFNACFETILSIKKNLKEKLTIRISKRPAFKGVDEIDIAFESRDIDPMSWHRFKLDVSSMAPKFGKLSFSRDLFTKYLLVFISRKYGGKVRVEELQSAPGMATGALHVTFPIFE